MWWLYLFAILVLFIVLYFTIESSYPDVIASKDNPILKHDAGGNATFLALLSHRYWPTWWLPTGHLQTIFTAFGANQLLVPTVFYHREPFVVRAIKKIDSQHKHGYYDGQVSLDWCLASSSTHSPLPIFVNNDMKTSPPQGLSPPKHVYRPPRYQETTPTVIILHGLAGGSMEPYVIRYVQRLHSHHGWRCVVFNARGCGGQELVSPQGYCGSYTEDVRQAVKSVHDRFPQAPLLGVGFSLGANILTKYAGEEGSSCLLTAAVVCANPFDLLYNSRAMHHSWWRRHTYSKALGSSLQLLFKRHQHQFTADPRIDSKQVVSGQTLRHFDIAVTTKLFNYETVDEYYRDARSSPYILKIRIPFLCLSALDDPICQPESIPIDEVRYNSNCIMVLTKSGGHSMDWYEGCRARSWSVRVADAFFTAVINRRQNQQHDQDQQIQTPTSTHTTATSTQPRTPNGMNGHHATHEPVNIQY